MAEEVIDHYIDRDGIKGDTQFLLDELNKGLEALNKMKGAKVTISTASNAKATTQAVSEGVKANAALAESVKAVNKVINERFATEAKLTTLQSDYNKATTANRIEIQKQNKELKNTIELRDAESGSIEKARARIKVLTAERNKLNLFTKEGQDRLKALNTEIDKNGAFIQKNADAYLKQKLNIGNYSGAVKTLETALADVRKKMDDYNKSGNVSQQTLAALNREEGLLVSLVDQQAQGFASATLELRNNEKALQQLKAAGLDTTAFYKELLQETGDLKDGVADLKQEIKNLGSDTRVFDGLVQGAQTLAGVYGIAQGAAALFGDENEELQKTFVKLQAVQTILAGLQGIQNALQKESSVMLLLNTVRTGALAAATKVYTFVTAGATAAARAFNGVLLASGIGAVLLLLPLAASAMESLGDSTDDTAKSTDELNKELDELNNKLNAAADARERLRNAEKGGLNELRRSLELSEAAGESENKRFAIRQQILERELYNLRTRKNSIEADGKQEIELAEQIKDKQNEIQAERLEFQRANAEKSKEIAKEAAEKAIEFAERERKARFEIAQFDQQLKVDRFKEQADNEGFSLRERTKARLDQFEAERVMAIAQRDFEISNTKLTSGERELIRLQSNKRIVDLEAQTAKDIIAIRQTIRDAETAQVDNDSAIIQEGIEQSEEDRFDRAIARIERQAEIETAANLERYKKGEIDKEQYEANKLGIENKTRRLSLLAEIDYQTQLLALSNLAPEKKLEAEKKLAALRKQLNADDLKNTEDTVNKKIELEAKKNEKIKELGSELRELAFTFLTAGLEREKNEIQGSIDALEQKKQKDIEVANQSIANSAQRADAIAVIEARANAQREQYEMRKRKLDTERARYERAANIASIIQSTAIAVVSALGAKPFTPANIALAAIVGAIGAVQIARTLATPLPKYFKGRTKNDPYEGPAVVGDGGKSEMIVRKDGTMEITPNTPTITNVYKGDVIHPDANVLLAMAKNSTDRTRDLAYLAKQTPDNSKLLTGGMNKMSKEIVKAIKDKTEVHIKTQSMRDLLFKDGPNFRNYLNDHI